MTSPPHRDDRVVTHPGTRVGPYEIVAPLGAGGMGEVYRATDTHLDRHVAIKVLPGSFPLDADLAARFTREAKTLATLNHPNIAAIHGIVDLPADRAPADVTKRGPDRNSHRWPHVLPGGRQFLFYAQGATSGLYLGSLDSPDSKRIAGADTGAQLVAPDWVLFVRQGMLIPGVRDRVSRPWTDGRGLDERRTVSDTGPRTLPARCREPRVHPRSRGTRAPLEIWPALLKR